jgi:hypothetical protein
VGSREEVARRSRPGDSFKRLNVRVHVRMSIIPSESRVSLKGYEMTHAELQTTLLHGLLIDFRIHGLALLIHRPFAHLLPNVHPPRVVMLAGRVPHG